MRWDDFWLGVMAGTALNYVIYEVLKRLFGDDKEKP